MLKKSLGLLDYEQQVIDKRDKTMDLGHNMEIPFEEGMEIAPLVDALREAGVPNYEMISEICWDKTRDFSHDKRLELSYVLAYALDFG